MWCYLGRFLTGQCGICPALGRGTPLLVGAELPFPSSQCLLALSLRFYVIMTSQRELFPRLTADMRRFKKLPRLQREVLEPVVGRAAWEAAEPEPSLARQQPAEQELWQDVEDSSEFYAGGKQVKLGPGLFYTSPLFPLLASEVASAQKQLSSMVQLAKCHCRRDNLWKRLFLLEPLASDKLKLGKLSLVELEELLDAVHGKSIADVDPQLVSSRAVILVPSSGRPVLGDGVGLQVEGLQGTVLPA